MLLFGINLYEDFSQCGLLLVLISSDTISTLKDKTVLQNNLLDNVKHQSETLCVKVHGR